MRNTPVRVVLVLLALAAVGGAGFYVYTLEQRAGGDAGRRTRVLEDALRLQATLADVRAAHAGYLADRSGRGGLDRESHRSCVSRLTPS